MIALAGLAFSVEAAAQDVAPGTVEQDPWASEDSLGFAEPARASLEPSLAPPTPRALSVTGFLRSDGGVWLERFDSNPLAKWRQSIDLDARYQRGPYRLVGSLYAAQDLAYVPKRHTYDQATLDAYETQIFAKELFASWSSAHFELSIGKQIVARGVGDVLSPIDGINPRDNREPGLAALSDLRLGVWATRAIASWSQQRLELMLVHRASFGLRSPIFGPFNPLAPLFGGNYAALAQATGASIDDFRFAHRPGPWTSAAQQALVRWSLAGSGFDLELYAGSVLDQFGVFGGLSLAAEAPRTLIFTIDHDRHGLLATAGSASLGDWLLKWELAAEVDRRFDLADASFASGGSTSRETTLAAAMLGLRYSGLQDTQVIVESSAATALKKIGPLLFPWNRPMLAARAEHALLHGDLKVTGQVIGFGARLQWGWLGHVDVSYALTDDWHASVGYATYRPGQRFGFIAGFESHDLLLTSLRCDFDLD